MVVHGGQGPGSHHYSYTKNMEKSFRQPTAFSHRPSKHNIPKGVSPNTTPNQTTLAGIPSPTYGG